MTVNSARTHAEYFSIVTARNSSGGASGFSARLCWQGGAASGATSGDGGAMRGRGFGTAVAAASASRSMPSSLAPSCRRTDTVLQGRKRI